MAPVASDATGRVGCPSSQLSVSCCPIESVGMPSFTPKLAFTVPNGLPLERLPVRVRATCLSDLYGWLASAVLFLALSP